MARRGGRKPTRARKQGNLTSAIPGARVDRRHGTNALDWADKGHWVGVKSSNVRGIRYEKDQRQLHVDFLNGASYIFEGVDMRVAIDMFNANSHGRFVSQKLSGKFPFVKFVRGSTSPRIAPR